MSLWIKVQAEAKRFRRRLQRWKEKALVWLKKSGISVPDPDPAEPIPEPDPPTPGPGPEPQPPATVIGPITRDGAILLRGGLPWLPIPLSADWMVQPYTRAAFDQWADWLASIHVDLVWAYAGGLGGKPWNVGNEAGRPFVNTTTLERNPRFDAEVLRRARELDKRGISIVWAGSFPDQGVYDRYTHELLWYSWSIDVQRAAPFSAILCPGAEYDEQSDKARDACVILASRSKRDSRQLVTLHPRKTNEAHAGEHYIDIVCLRADKVSASYIHTRTEDLIARFNKPVVWVEDSQGLPDQAIYERFNAAREAHGHYVITGRNGALVAPQCAMSNKMADWLRGM